MLTLLLSSLSVSVENRSQGDIRLSWIACSFAGLRGKNLGIRECDDPAAAYSFEGDAIEAAEGNTLQVEPDFVGGAATGLSLVRYYNSDDTVNHGTNGPGFASNWTTAWHRYVFIRLPLEPETSWAEVFRPCGRVDEWELNGSGQWVTDPDVRSKFSLLTDAGENVIGVRIVTADDTIEEYKKRVEVGFYTHFYLTRITRRGLETNLAYDANNNLTQVTGPFGHSLTFSYDDHQHVSKMTVPNGDVYTYDYVYSFEYARGVLSAATYPDGSKRQYLYENTSLPWVLTGLIDENGNRFATWTYSTESFWGNALSSEHAGGVDKTTLSYRWDDHGLLTTKVTDARGNEHTYTFESLYTMYKATVLSGTPVRNCGGKAFTYDYYNGFMDSSTDWNDNITTYSHDARGNETSRTEAYNTPLARTVETTWHPSYNLPTRIVEPNRTTDFSYDANGNLLSKRITSDGSTRSFLYTYNDFSQMLTAEDPLGNVTSLAYDTKRNLTSVTNPLGHITQYTAYDLNGMPLTIVDPNGVTTTLTYDGRGRLTSRTVGTLKTTYAYDLAGNLIRIILPDDSFLNFSYDAAHRLIGIEDALGNRMAYTLDAAGNVTSEQAFDSTNVETHVHSYAYDAVNRLVRSVGARGQKTSYAYDLQSNLKAVRDPLGHKTRYSYDALNRRTRITDPNDNATSLRYDALDHLTSLIDARGLKTSYTWTGLDDEKEVTSPDTGSTTRTFDAAGNVLTSTDAGGKTTSYTYDALNRMTKETFSDGASVAWQYDVGANGKGRLKRIKDRTGSTDYSYDTVGHVTRKRQVISGLTLTTLYGYDAGGRLASITYPSGKQVVYGYDAAGGVISLTVDGQSLIGGATYSPFGGVTGWRFGNGATYRRRFDKDNRIKALALPAGNKISLAYDAVGRIKTITDNKVPTKTFGYDSMGRLTTYESGAKAQSYEYDADGNRTSASLKDGTTTNIFTYAYASTSNRLSSISGAWNEAFTYTPTGSTAAHKTPSAKYTFSYDARGRLVKAKLGALARTYWLNGLGQRVLKKDPAQPANNMYFVYDLEGHLIGEYGPGGAVVQETVWLGDLPVATLQPAGNFHIAPDHLGAPHQITNAARHVVWRWNHDPFGIGAPTGSLTYNPRFPGQYYDAETGLNYNYHRDYDPKLGRYIQSDPIGLAGGQNTYTYASGNPVSGIDAFGLEPWWMKMIEWGNQFGYAFAPDIVANNLKSGVGLRDQARRQMDEIKDKLRICKSKKKKKDPNEEKKLEEEYKKWEHQYKKALDQIDGAMKAKDLLEKGKKFTNLGDPVGIPVEIITSDKHFPDIQHGAQDVGNAVHGVVDRGAHNLFFW
jgi:RHS repeat-associated protein